VSAAGAAPDAGARAAGTGLCVLTPLRLEARALRAGAPELEVAVCGVGRARAGRAVARARERGAQAIVLAGFCGALAPDLRPGDLLVATEVRDGKHAFAVPAAGELLDALAAAGVEARPGVIASTAHPALGRARRRLSADAVDMESAALAEAAGDVPWAVLRAVLDTPGREPWRPLATLGGFRHARRALRASAPGLARFPSAVKTGMMP
jgi:4-hydroxy-3-methylbut-2-enyl diphosphate reductase